MSKTVEYKIEIPLFTNEVSEIWKDMPNIIEGLVNKKQKAIDEFTKLDTAINGGALRKIGIAFGEPIYARVRAYTKDEEDYKVKRLASMMANFMIYDTEEIVIGGKRYVVVFKEDV